MSEILKLYSSLNNRDPQNKGFLPVEKLSFSDNFFIGISENKTPMFLIEHEFQNNTTDFNLKHISVLFNKKCNLIDNNKQTTKTCTVIILRDLNSKFQDYFLEVMYTMLHQISENPDSEELKNEIDKIVQLFSSLSRPAIKTVQGLWAELFIISQAQNPKYLIKSWHPKPESKFDFNDGKDKIEVKSTSKQKRIHTFSNDQLLPNKNSKLIIASVFSIESGTGKNIYDLRDIIFSKTSDMESQTILDSAIFKTLGNDLNNALDIFFDYQQACDTVEFFDSEKVPKIKEENLPSEISEVKFNCDLSDIESIEKEELLKSDSILFRSLI